MITFLGRAHAPDAGGGRQRAPRRIHLEHAPRRPHPLAPLRRRAGDPRARFSRRDWPMRASRRSFSTCAPRPSTRGAASRAPAACPSTRWLRGSTHSSSPRATRSWSSACRPTAASRPYACCASAASRPFSWKAACAPGGARRFRPNRIEAHDGNGVTPRRLPAPRDGDGAPSAASLVAIAPTHLEGQARRDGHPARMASCAGGAAGGVAPALRPREWVSPSHRGRWCASLARRDERRYARI